MKGPKRKNVGIKDVAKKAQVSMSAVSMSLTGSSQIGETTRQRVMDVCRELGYVRPVRKNSGEKERVNLGFVLIGSESCDETYVGLLRALSSSVSARGGRLGIHDIPDVSDHEAVLRNIQDYATGSEGLVLMGTIDSNLLEKIKTCGIKLVIVGSAEVQAVYDRPYLVYSSVDTDVVGMGCFTTSWLMMHGYQRIGFICEVITNGMFNDLWLNGYHLAHSRANISLDPELVHVAGETFVGGESAAEAFLAMSEPPDAYVIPDARLASSFCTAMSVRGHVVDPERLVIAGLPNTIRNYNLQNVPMVMEDVETMADVAIDLLWRIRERNTIHNVRILVPFLTRNMKTDG